MYVILLYIAPAGAAFDPFNQNSKGPAPPLEQKSDDRYICNVMQTFRNWCRTVWGLWNYSSYHYQNLIFVICSPEEKIKQMEKKVNELIEESCIANGKGQFQLVNWIYFGAIVLGYVC